MTAQGTELCEQTHGRRHYWQHYMPHWRDLAFYYVPPWLISIINQIRKGLYGHCQSVTQDLRD